MTEKRKKAAPHKIFDVARPGKTAPSASSKPILITNRPVLQDPMMIDGVPAETSGDAPRPSTKIAIDSPHDDDTKAPPVEAESAQPLVKQAGELVIQPLSRETPEAPESAVPEVSKSAEVTSSDAAPTTETTPKVEKIAAPVAEMPPTDQVDDRTPADTDDKEQTADESKSANLVKADEETARKQAERATELAKLTESHKYYLPINQIEKRKNKRYALLGILVILLLGVAWIDVSLDAGIIHLAGIKPLTHFFSK